MILPLFNKAVESRTKTRQNHLSRTILGLASKTGKTMMLRTTCCCVSPLARLTQSGVFELKNDSDKK
jgi:hypothetical protein